MIALFLALFALVASVSANCGCRPQSPIDMYKALASKEDFQKDIILTPADKLYVSGFRNTNPSRLWPGRTLYYTVSHGDRNTVANALNGITKATNGCVKFVYGKGNGNYVNVINRGNGVCNSNVGVVGGQQGLSLGSGCWHTHIIQHEFLHALGFWHEQSRRDRNNHITIHWQNILSYACFNFNYFGTVPRQAYDKYSIMHYESWSFRCSSNLKTLTDKQGRDVGGRKLTSLDIQKIRALYRC